MSVDALGNPLRLRLTPGQAHEAPQAEALLKEQQAEFVLADKGYDAEHVRATIRDLGAEPVIPPRAKRLNPSDYDAERYKERHLVECFFSKLKHYRRVFSRFDKLARHYLSFLYFASTLIWLRPNVNRT